MEMILQWLNGFPPFFNAKLNVKTMQSVLCLVLILIHNDVFWRIKKILAIHLELLLEQSFARKSVVLMFFYLIKNALVKFLISFLSHKFLHNKFWGSIYNIQNCWLLLIIFEGLSKKATCLRSLEATQPNCQNKFWLKCLWSSTRVAARPKFFFMIIDNEINK